jgi:L-alanine-DL-glutamate epimerase-like enolase superfamily enzyme
MRLERLEVCRFPVPFRRAFRHASASRRQAENLIVVARSACGLSGYGEGCPRAYVTGERVEGGAAFLRALVPALSQRVTDLASLRAWIADHRAEIDANPAAFAAAELALLDLLGKAEGKSLEALLGLPPLAGRFRYTAVLGDLPLPLFLWQLWRYRRSDFADFKVKLSGRPARDRSRLARFRAEERLRVDANNLWRRPERAIAHLQRVGVPLAAVEEPLAAGDLAGFARAGEALSARIVLDESLLRLEQLDALPAPERWIANLRVSKQGGLLRSLALAKRAAERGIAVIVGAQVGETSLLTRAALTLMQAAGANLLAAEGAFGTHLLARDLTTPCLMFGRGGVLDTADWPELQAPGLGLEVREAALVPAP